MNKIFKVIYSKTRHCYVVVSELAKSHCKTTQSHTVRSKTALTAAVLLALGAFSFVGMPVVQAADGTESLRNNDFVGANDQYWYYDKNDKEWKTYQYKLTSAFNNRARGDLPNYQGGGAKFPGAVTAGLYAQAGQQTVTIGDRNAGQSKGSVFIGEHSGYNNGNNDPAGMKNNYVTSVGFQSDATGWGSIAIGSNATAENSKMESQVVKEVGDAHTSGTVSDDTYGIEENPTIQGASVALGYNAHSKDGNIAIGSYSDATSTDKGDSYVSVGNGTLKRRITNVAKGTDNSDVVTVGQMNDAIKQADNLNVNAGWGINVADEQDTTGKVTKNVISLKHNLGTGYNDDEANGMIIGGLVEDRDPAKQYGAADANSVIVGAGKALASGKSSVVVGGLDNVASGATSVVVGGDNNNAAGNQSAVFGGRDNTAAGIASTAGGGIMNVANGQQAVALGGAYNYALGTSSTAIGGTGGNGMYGYSTSVNGNYSVSLAGGSTGTDALNGLAAGNQSVVTTANGTAVGYQATTDQEGTIAFGHDAGDVSGYAVTWKQRTDGKTNADHTTNDYTQVPDSVTPTTYQDAYYNRLVKVADGQDDHDVVVMEQLKQYANKDALNLGNNIKVYKTDEKGNVQLDKDKKPVEDTGATTNAQNVSKDAWGQALGAGTLTAATAKESDQLVTGKTLYNYDKPTGSTNYVNANNTTGQNLSALDAQVKSNADTLNDKTHNIKYYSVSDNAPTLGFDSYSNAGNDGAKGKGSLAAGFVTHADGIASTVVGSYSGVMNKGTALGPWGLDYRGATAVSLGTVNVNNNTDTSKTYSGVANSIVGQANMTTNSNAAIIYGAGNTVTDSYRPINKDKALAILGNVSDPTKLSKAMQDAVKDSGGQVMVMGGGNNVESAYMSQVVGVGNTVKGNQVEKTKGEWVTDTSDTAIKDYNSEKSSQYNYVDGFNNEVINGKHDYVIGANNKLSGDSYDDDKVLPIKRSNKSNIVIGDNHTLTREKNTVIIGSSDTENTQTENTQTKANDAVIIGHNANATSDTGADNAVAIGRAAKATGGNAVTIGVNTSAGDNSITIGSESHAISGSNIAIGRYARVYGDKVTNAVALGHNANAKVADGVAIGSNSIATVAGNSVEGYDPTTGQTSKDTTATWQATNAAVSIGKADGTVTRQINGVAAGTNDTDAVNVAQLKKLEGMKANVDASNVGSNIKVYKTGDDKTPVLDDEATKQKQTENENAWGAAIGTGEVAKDNGQLVTGKTVYDALHGGLDDVVFGHDGKDGKDGSIGLVGPKGQDGKDGKTTTIIKTETGAPGVNGEDGKDGITRIVYNDKDNPTDKHTVATLDDGMKYAGDTGDAANVALNHQLKLSGTTFGEDKVHKSYDEKDWTSDNIAVVSDKVDKDGNAVMNLKLSKDLKDLNSSTYTTTETTGEGDQKQTTDYTTTIDSNGVTIQSKVTKDDKTEVVNGPSMTIDGINGGGKQITNVGDGFKKNADGSYTISETDKKNAANIGDVQTIVDKATKDLTEGTNGLNNKANIDASNIGSNIKVYKTGDDKTPVLDDEATKQKQTE
ncbi:ESPR-type extended signal peptide-containing protein, partial [Megasphaera elsdenii]|uniref:ESPR-type extended signal peptide-containing protein n=1 Tax=Megasphaera elsdenii TaxID=907 RepID=UPI003F7F944F